jgi:hypothetical protein
LDHLVFGVPDLARGIEWVELAAGVRARIGGQHPGRATHNALLSLGGRQYLEIIALDPEQAEAPGLLYPALKTLSEPRFIAWAVAVDNVADIAMRVAAANIETIGPLEGARVQADGSLLAWKTLRITGPSVEGLPFFIEWQKGAPHPSQTSPAGCRLTSFEIDHTDPEETRRILKSLDAEATITLGARVRLKARLQTPKGEVELG